jgi:hypothetical protein
VRGFVNPFGITGAVYSIIMFTFGIVSFIGNFQNDDFLIAIIVCILFVLLSIHYFLFAKKQQCFSTDEQQQLFKFHVIKLNKNKRKSLVKAKSLNKSQEFSIHNSVLIKKNKSFLRSSVENINFLTSFVLKKNFVFYSTSSLVYPTCVDSNDDNHINNSNDNKKNNNSSNNNDNNDNNDNNSNNNIKNNNSKKNIAIFDVLDEFPIEISTSENENKITNKSTVIHDNNTVEFFNSKNFENDEISLPSVVYENITNKKIKNNNNKYN